jgi:hypothetical protein
MSISPPRNFAYVKRLRRRPTPQITRLLQADYRRPRAPISLPGRIADGNGATAMRPAASDEKRPRTPGPTPPHPRTDEEPLPTDGAGPYTHDQLLMMDQRFAARLDRAIASGKEHLPR